jgi:hemoglobin-like flavoprotein
MTSASDAALITESLEIAAERGGDLTKAVYARLFARQPEMRALFVLDTNDAVKGEMLARAFDAILDFIGERRYGHRFIQAEIVTHEGYNVPRNVFASFFAIIAETVHEACGSAFTDSMAAAWRRLLTELDTYVANP